MPLYDFHCPDCDTKFENVVPYEQKTSECACGGTAERMFPAPELATLNDPVRRAEALKKRSLEHSVNTMKQNPEKLAAAHGGKPKAQNPWNAVHRKRTS